MSEAWTSMAAWMEANWYVVLPLTGAVAWAWLKVHRRGGDEPLLLRVPYAVFPILDAKSDVRRELTPLKMFVWVTAFAIAAAYAYYDLSH